MNLSLEGKRAFVCGSTEGIGRAAALELATLGASVILLARNPEKLQATLALLPQSGSQRHGLIIADFSQPEQLAERLAAWSAQDNGLVHILVNNTGGPAAGPAHTAAVSDFKAAFDQHLVCNHILATHLIPGMKAAGYGRIINVISTSVKQPLPNLGVSNTIRGAVANWAKTLANELGPYGITVNNVLPGATATGRLDSIIRNKASKSGTSESDAAHEMMAEIPARRFAEPEETAYAIAFLAGPSAAYINGINLPVDGGRTASL
jgi:3-oxoacyl-[acyl-carrier protein] reductase